MTLLLESAPPLTDARSRDDAERVQRALSSSLELAVGGVRAACDVREAQGVGGDFVDLLEVDGCLLAVLGDVSGKGSAASLIAAMLLASVQHHAAQVGPRPGALLTAVEVSMRGVLERTGTIVTLVVAAVDPVDRTLRIASVGHHPVVVRSPRGSVPVLPTCPPLGTVPPCGAERAFAFPHGTVLALVSDGITEQPGPDGVDFGFSGLDRALSSAPRDPRAAVAEVMDAVDRHAAAAPVFDDRAAVVVCSGDVR